MAQTKKSFNPIATLMRTIDGPAQSFGLAAHSDEISRYFQSRDKAGKLEGQLDMAEYLVDGINTKEQAQEAIEWMAARWPSSFVARKNYMEGDLDIEDGGRRAKALMDLMVEKGADLSLPIHQPEVLEILEHPTISLGEILVQLGHTQYSPEITPPNDLDEIEKLARSCARNGDLANASYWIERAGKNQKHLNHQVWLALSREKTTPLEDLALLPDPPAAWWTISYDHNTYRQSAKIRSALSQLKPDHFLSHIQAAMLTNNVHSFSHEDLVSAMKQQDVWRGETGIEGSALEIAIAHTVQVAEGRKQMQELNDLTSNVWPMLLARLGGHQPGALSKQEWKDIIEMTGSSGTKEMIRSKPAAKRLSGDELRSILDRLPKTPHGAPDPGLSFIMGLATTSTDDIATMRRMLPAMRALLDHDDFSPMQIYERGCAVAGMTKLFTQRQNTVKPGNLSNEDACVYIESMLWRFVGSRMIQRDRDRMEFQDTLTLSPQQKSYANVILTLLEDGHYPDWDGNTGKRMLSMLSSPLMGTPERILSALQYEGLKETPKVSASRMGRRL